MESQTQAEGVYQAKFLASSSFVGRHREIDELKSALEAAQSGQGRVVMLVGEPGIGKTRTAQELATYAESRGTRVLWGWCYEEAGAPPTGPGSSPCALMFSRQTPTNCSPRWEWGLPTSPKSSPKYGNNCPA